MFTENVWDPWGSPSRRGWTMLISFTVQAFGVALLLLVPLIYIGALPKIDFVDHVFLPLPPASAHPSTAPRTTAKPSSNFVNGVVLAPRSIPLRVSMVDDRGLTPPQTDLGIGVPFRTGAPNSTNPVINSIGDTSQPFVPRPPAPGGSPTSGIGHNGRLPDSQGRASVSAVGACCPDSRRSGIAGRYR
jgi:hypothetical protein